MHRTLPLQVPEPEVCLLLQDGNKALTCLSKRTIAFEPEPEPERKQDGRRVLSQELPFPSADTPLHGTTQLQRTKKNGDAEPALQAMCVGVWNGQFQRSRRRRAAVFSDGQGGVLTLRPHSSELKPSNEDAAFPGLLLLNQGVCKEVRSVEQTAAALQFVPRRGHRC